MPLKSLENRKFHNGFIAYYSDGKVIKERENFFSKVLNKKCSTNWAEIDKSKLVKLELVWQNQVKGYITCTPHPDAFNTKYTLSPQDWFFSHNGYFDLGSKSIVVVARNIGYTENGYTNILSVAEQTGIIRIHGRPIP
jgi:hypothetical protein